MFVYNLKFFFEISTTIELISIESDNYSLSRVVKQRKSTPQEVVYDNPSSFNGIYHMQKEKYTE